MSYMSSNLGCQPPVGPVPMSEQALPLGIVLALQGGVWLAIGLGVGYWLWS